MLLKSICSHVSEGMNVMSNLKVHLKTHSSNINIIIRVKHGGIKKVNHRLLLLCCTFGHSDYNKITC